MSAWGVIPELAAWGASTLGPAFMQRDANEEAMHANLQQAQADRDLQKEFAQMGIRWKVADAQAAGIHPLFALGGQTASYTPVSNSIMPDTSMADAMAGMGQNIHRAIGQTRTAEEKEMAALNLASARTQLEGQQLDNAIRASQLQKLGSTQPPMAGSDNFAPGQGNSPVMVKPAERTASQAGRLAQEAGWRPDVSYSRTDTGLTPMVPTSLSESLEDDIIGKFMWRIRNQLLPNINGGGAPPKSQLPKGATHWEWSRKAQEWRPSYETKKKQPWDYRTDGK